MNERETANGHGTTDGLWRWLVGGLVTGGVVLGLMVAAYAVGYNRGQDVAAPAATATPLPPPPPPTTTTTGTTPSTGAIGAVTVTPALVASGRKLYTSAGCSACHSLTGAAGAGPSFKGVAGGTSTLDTGETVSADDAYLARSITDPDAEVVKGYHAGIMGPAIAGDDLSAKPDDVRALVAFIKSQR